MALTLLGAAAMTGSCRITLSFTEANIPVAATTFSVAYFPNNSPMVSPMLSNTLTEAIIDRFTRQTRLDQASESGDLAIEGEITGYMTAPSAITADSQFEGAAMNRLTITVQVRFVNVLEPEWNFPPGGKSFTAYADYPGTAMLQDVAAGLEEEIVTTLVDQIFNATVANW
jgi:hypothetical protein